MASKIAKIGVIGLGGRGRDVMKAVLLPRENVAITAVCDVYEDRVDMGAALVCDAGKPAPAKYTNYHDLIADENVEAVLIMTSWEPHIDMACECMEAGKPVGVEVGGAYSVDDCFRLVRTQERTGVKCMLMENCCYGRYELLALNMVKQGLFGEVVHLSGGYHHDLRQEVAFGKENRHYRLRNYLARNCENYPTHELGPIAKLIGINDGNRMLTLTSTASKSRGVQDYIARKEDADKSLLDKTFAQGDIVTTVIKCANGETIVLTLDTSLPRYYSRGFTVRGTRGMFEEATKSIYLDTPENEAKHFKWNEEWGNADKYLENYEHPIWKKYIKEGVTGGHDGIDWLVYGAFADCVTSDYDPPIDVYDMAAWMVISTLSEQSIARGGAPVDIPDFTNGKWIERKTNINPEYAF